MRDLSYRYRVVATVVVDVWAPNADGALARAARAVFGARWRSFRGSARVVSMQPVSEPERRPGVR